MSVESMAIALHHSRATGAAKLILVGIANHDGDGGAWPSMATLAKYAGITARNAQKAVQRLEELGEVRVFHQAGGNARTASHARPNLYEFLLTCSPDCDRSKNHRSRYELIDPLSLATPPVGSDTPPPVGSDTPPPVASDTRTIPRNTHKKNEDSAVGTRASVPPAPHVPKFDPSSIPARPKLVSIEQQALNDDAKLLECPAQGGRFKHMIPATGSACVRCNQEAHTILDHAQELSA